MAQEYREPRAWLELEVSATLMYSGILLGASQVNLGPGMETFSHTSIFMQINGLHQGNTVFVLFRTVGDSCSRHKISIFTQNRESEQNQIQTGKLPRADMGTPLITTFVLLLCL